MLINCCLMKSTNLCWRNVVIWHIWRFFTLPSLDHLLFSLKYKNSTVGEMARSAIKSFFSMVRVVSIVNSCNIVSPTVPNLEVNQMLSPSSSPPEDTFLNLFLIFLRLCRQIIIIYTHSTKGIEFLYLHYLYYQH